MDDHYKTLGISENATQEEIKAAYRNLAKQHHPDLNRDNPRSEALFKKINEANDVLGDERKRAEYDQQRRFGANPRSHGHGGPFGGFSFNFGAGGDAFDDIINQFFNQGFGRQSQPQRNKDFQFTINISLEEAFVGKTMPVGFDANGVSRNVSVSIPAGVQHGTRLRFQGHGDRSINGLPPGDLYVMVSINDHPLYRRDGPHLHASAKIDALNAMVGTSVAMRTIDGQDINVSIAPGTQHGTVLRVAGKGMPSHHSSRQRGDMFVTVHVEVPRNLDEDDLRKLNEIVSKRNGATK
jgi:curved DNA-binding protein